jgi:hypothetical protein
VIDRIFRGSAKVRTGAVVVARNPALVVIPLLAAVTVVPDAQYGEFIRLRIH